MPFSFDTVAVAALVFIALRGLVLTLRADLARTRETEERKG